jgi:hypothetical protein
MGTSSAVGGYADGVLGCTTDAGRITILAGWDWYAGSDLTQIGMGQYDFETVVIHELGHALGLGHSASPTSVMFVTLAAGTVNRVLAPADLNVPDTDGGACGLHAAIRQAVGPPVAGLVEVRNAPAGPGDSGSFFQELTRSSGQGGTTAAVAVASPAATASAGPHDGTAAAWTNGFVLRDLLPSGTPAAGPPNATPLLHDGPVVALPSTGFGSVEQRRLLPGVVGNPEIHSGTADASEVPSLPNDPLWTEETSPEFLDLLFREEVLTPRNGENCPLDADSQHPGHPLAALLADDRSAASRGVALAEAAPSYGWLYSGVAPATGLENLAELDAVWASTNATWEGHERSPEAPASVAGLAVALLAACVLSPSRESEARRRSRRGLPWVEAR